MPSYDLEYAMFSRAEMERRYARAREEMDRRGLDALFVTGEENFQYFTGTTASAALHASLTRPSVFVLPLDGEPIVVTQGQDNLALGSYVTDVRGYTNLFEFPKAVVIRALRDAGAAGGSVGAELGLEQRMGMPAGAYQDLTSALTDLTFVDAADVIVNLRMVKSEEEIAYIRQAGEVTARARQRLFRVIRPGMTERETARLLRRLILEEGGDGTSFVMQLLGIPGSRNPFGYDRPLEAGQVVGVDTGARVGMYTIDYTRWGVLGPASDALRRMYDALLEVNRKMAAALGPGVTCAEIYRVGNEAIDTACSKTEGLERFGPSRMGHGQGMLITEPPSIHPEDQTPLAPGMVLSTEPGLSAEGVQMLWEDVFLITENGSVQITLESDELREIQS
ncbi:MAG: Xaa-Pro peptidase family protein [Gemmatimonadota bacterium]|nr:Xaa-Pro peptidase family protein [Gemmatimonadota bacterium]